MMDKTFKAQSAMEYLMTYGWAILIIAVVLGALFSLGVFNGTSLLGTACVADPGYLCQSAVLSSTGTLSFNFGQNTGSTIYNIEMACGATVNTAGLPFNSLAMVVITPAGNTVNSNTVPGGAWSGNALSLVSGQSTTISNLICYGTTGVPMGSQTPTSNAATAATIGTAFTGYIWLNYTTYSSTPTTPSGNNQWFSAKVATLTIKVV